MIRLSVNGRIQELTVKPHWTLLHVLRDKLGLTGTKLGCGTGECGTCTVLINGKAVHSCLMLAAQADGKEITTIEGLTTDGKLTALQKSIIEHHAFQCGFCTPGILMTAKALLDDNPNPTEEEIKSYLNGNLCRCGTYKYVIDAIKDLTKRSGGCK